MEGACELLLLESGPFTRQGSLWRGLSSFLTFFSRINVLDFYLTCIFSFWSKISLFKLAQLMCQVSKQLNK